MNSTPILETDGGAIVEEKQMMNKEKVIEIFNSNGDDLFNAIENGNHKKTDRIAKKLEKVYIAFVSDNKLARECIPILLKSDNVATGLF